MNHTALRPLVVALACAAGAGSPIAQHRAAPEVVWADHDGDGLLDALWVDPLGRLVLVRNDGDGGFSDARATAGLDGIEGARLVRCEDVDADGDPDLYVALPNGSLLLRNDGGTYVDVGRDAGITDAGVVRDATWRDVDEDGRLDLVAFTDDGTIVHRALGQWLFEPIVVDVPAAAASVTPGAGPVVSADAPQAGTLDRGPVTSSGRTVADGTRRVARAPDRVPLATTPAAAATTGTPHPEPQSGGTFVEARFCTETLRDVATGDCMPASSEPTLGSLFPLSPSFFVDPEGQVGINTTTPSARLDIVAAWPDAPLRVADSAGDGILLVTNAGRVGVGTESPSGALHVVAPPGISPLYALNSSGDGLNVRSSGRVGIGTTAPTAALDIDGETETALSVVGNPSGPAAEIRHATDGIALSVINAGLGEDPIFQVGNTTDVEFDFLSSGELVADLAFSVETAVGRKVTLNSVGIGALDGGGPAPLALNRDGGTVGIGLGTEDAELNLQVVDGADLKPASGGAFAVGVVSAHNLAMDSNEIMVRNNGVPQTLYLNRDGGNIVLGGWPDGANVGVGVLSPAFKLDVDGDIRCVSLTQTSDARLKRDVEPVERALATVLALRGVSYTWDPDFSGYEEGRHLGLLAQEVRELVPEAVREDDAGMLSVAYTALVPLLIEAVEEQQRSFENELAALRAEVDALKQANGR